MHHKNRFSRLGIFEKRLSEIWDEAEKLLIGKLEEVLPTLEDEQLKIAVKERITFLRHEPIKWKTELRVCRLEGCGNKFYPKKRNQIFCCYECMKKTHQNPRRKRGRKAEQTDLNLIIT